MGLKIMSGRDGKPRETWYARFTRNGKKVNVNLRVPIRGTIPTTTDDTGHVLFDADGAGDAAFTKSRKAALSALAAMEKAAKRTGDTTAVKQAKTADIARRYRISRPTMYRMIKSGRVRTIPLNGVIRVLIQSLVDCANANR